MGLLFQPTLIASVRSGVVPLADIASRIVGLSAAAADRVRELLQSPLPALRLDGIALSRWLGPDHVAADLLALASHPDAATRRALVRLAIADRGPWVRRLVEAAPGPDDSLTMVAMQVMLARREAPLPGEAEQLVRSPNPSVAACAWLLVEGAKPGAAFERLGPLLQHPEAASDVIEGIVAAGRDDCAAALVAALPAAPAEQQQHGLAFLRRSRTPVSAPSWRILGRFARHHDPGADRSDGPARRLPSSRGAAALSRGLVDWSPMVRRRASEALAAQADGGVAFFASTSSGSPAAAPRPPAR